MDERRTRANTGRREGRPGRRGEETAPAQATTALLRLLEERRSPLTSLAGTILRRGGGSRDLRDTAVQERAEDCVQDATVDALKAIDRFDPTRGTMTAWFTRILVNRCRMHLRAAACRRHIPVPHGELTSGDTENYWGHLLGGSGDPATALLHHASLEDLTAPMSAIETYVVWMVWLGGDSWRDAARDSGFDIPSLQAADASARIKARERLAVLGIAPPDGYEAAAAAAAAAAEEAEEAEGEDA